MDRSGEYVGDVAGVVSPKTVLNEPHVILGNGREGGPNVDDPLVGPGRELLKG